jgi:hypothetical protein
VNIPNQANLIGMDIYTQGLLASLTGPLNIVLTNGLDLHLGR